MQKTQNTQIHPLDHPQNNQIPQSSSEVTSRKRTRAQFNQESRMYTSLIKVRQTNTTKNTKKRVQELDKDNDNILQSLKVQQNLSTNNKRAKSISRTEKKKTKPTRQSNLVEFFNRKKCKYAKCKQDVSDIPFNCEICNDSYHWQCSNQFKSQPSITEEFICQNCTLLVRDFKKVKLVTNDSKQLIACSQCTKDLSSDEDKNQCVKCRLEFHKSCFEKSTIEIFCQKCSVKFEEEESNLLPQVEMHHIRSQSPLISVKSSKNLRNMQLTSFFKQSKNASSMFQNNVLFQTPTQSQLYGEVYSQDMMKKPQRKKSLSQTRKKNIFRLPKLLDDPILEQEIKDSFKVGLFAKGMKYTTHQVYDDPKCPESMNNPDLESNIQKLIKENQQAVYELRKREKLGIFPPLMIKYDSLQGFYVEAAQDMPELTLLCEYGGEVRTFRQCLFDKNDSIMELLDTGDSETSLNILTIKNANVGRFFNSVINSSKEAKKKQNIRSLRCQIDGKVTVIIFTKRAVKQGENLLYDYNEAKNLYPTEEFV